MDLTPNRQPSRWEKITPMERRLIIALILAVTISMALMFALIFARPIIVIAQNAKVMPKEDTCLSEGCIRAASQILERIDQSAKPCDNFYDFVCGKYIKKTSVPATASEINAFQTNDEKIQSQLYELIQDATDDEFGTIDLINYHRACMNTTAIEKNGLESLRTVLEKLGGWPVLEGDEWKEDEYSWTKLIYKLRETGINTDYFFGVLIDVDTKNTSRCMIKIKQPDFGLTEEYLIKGLNEDFVKAYYDFMIEVAVILGADKQFAMEELKQSLEFEIKLANFSLSEVEVHEVSELYNALTITELQQNYPSVPWLEFFNKIVAVNNTQLYSDEIVLLTTPNYLSLFEDVINNTPKRVQANYAIWRSIRTLVPFLTEKLIESELRFNNAIGGMSEKQVRREKCTREATNRLTILANALYVRKYFTKESKKSVLEMVKYIREAFTETLKTTNWMDTDTLRNALEKANAIKEVIGYPDELLDKNIISEIYKPAEIYVDQYLQSYLNLNHLRIDSYFNTLRQPVNKDDWINYANAIEPNTTYRPTVNSIILSAGILQGLFFEIDRPHYMNFGTLGSIVGHELTHGFDDSGRKHDKNGLVSDWWAPKTKELFLNNAQCFEEQYNNYTVSALGENLNGENTRNENIADNGGVKQAYIAYKNWVKSNKPELKLPGLNYSPNQLFWISYAMPWCTVYKPSHLKSVVASSDHSPSEFRVVGPLSNSAEFSEDFNCPLDSMMNPKKKCIVW